MSYVRGTVKDSAPKFVTFWLVLGIWRGDTGMIWRHRKITSSSFGYNIIWGGGQSNFVWLTFCFLSEAGSCSRYLEISSSCLVYLRKKEIFFLHALRFVVTYLCPVRSRRRDCSRKVKDGWFVGLIFFFSFWASSKLMFCCRTPNSRRATISYFGLIGNLLKREVEFWQFKGNRTLKSSSCAIYLWQKL